MNKNELAALAESLTRFRIENVKCDSKKCDDCDLYIPYPAMMCGFGVIHAEIVKAGYVEEGKNK